MGEDLDLSQKTDYIPTDNELDEGGWKFADPLLTESELEALNQKNRGIMLAPQHQYDDLEDFKKRQNNFHAYFDFDSKGMSLLYRRRKVFQRLVALKPDLVSRVANQYYKYRTESAPFSDFSDEMWRNLYEAYQSMSRLVDLNDSYVRRPENGQLDDHFLVR